MFASGPAQDRVPTGRTLLRGHAGEAVHDAGVPGDLAALDARVGVLGLQQQLDALDGRHGGLGHRAGDAACQQIRRELRRGRHLAALVLDHRDRRGVRDCDRLALPAHVWQRLVPSRVCKGSATLASQQYLWKTSSKNR